jgi:hypothetical protein
MRIGEEKGKMKKSIFLVLLIAVLFATVARADTLHLRSGQSLEGTFLSADAKQIRFRGSDGQPKMYAVDDVESITFAVRPPPPPPPPPPPMPTSLTVPAGTTLLIRMVDSLDTTKTKTGQIFSASLETSLVADNFIVARKGTIVHGKVTHSENARRLTGKSDLQLALSDIVINGVAYPLVSSSFSQKGKSEGAQTAKKVAGGAGLGAAIGAIGGNAGKGAAIGAVSGVGLAAVKKGEPIRVPSETLLEFTLGQSTTLPVSK